MTQDLWLLWFPTALATAAVCALLARPRGHFVAGLAALYWIMLASSISATPVFHSASALAAIVAGAAVIAWIGIWATPARRAVTAHDTVEPATKPAVTEPSRSSDGMVVDLLDRFDDWQRLNHHKSDPWPDFGEFVRTALYMMAGARNVRAYRLMSDDDRLIPLRQLDYTEEDFPSARAGLLGHVVTTGKRYLRDDPAQGELVEQLAENNGHSIGWCFAVRSGPKTIGVVHCAQFEHSAAGHADRLALCERLVGLCWTLLAESCRGRIVDRVDPLTGVLSYRAFLDSANHSMQESYHNAEPCALVVVDVEGLRRMHDNGRSGHACELMREVSAQLSQRVRQDDVLGVLDGSRFLLLMRRVDSELGTLIVRQLLEKLLAICQETERWKSEVNVRCGVSGSGVDQPALATLMSRALRNVQEARQQKIDIVSELPEMAGAHSI